MAVPRFAPLHTERLVLRAMRPDDADALWRRRNDASTARYQNWTLPYGRERAEQLVGEMVAFDSMPPADGWFQLAIDDRADGTTVGDLALGFTFDGRCADLGWTVDAAARGRGIATEAAMALVAWLFDTVGVSRVQAMLHPENVASARVAEHLGMVIEGHTRNSYWVGDENSDDLIYAMTPADWHAWNRRPRTRPEVVELVEVTERNLQAVKSLATHWTQERFVYTMSDSLADALVPALRNGHRIVPWFRAVVADGEIVGFVMLDDSTEQQPIPFVMRLLIDRMHQQRGIGSAVLDLVIDRARAGGATAVDISWVEGVGTPAPFYFGRGFELTGAVDGDEVLARLTF